MEATYRLAGLSIERISDDGTVAELVDSRLSALRSDAVVGADITLELRGPLGDAEWPERPSGAGRPIYDLEDLAIDYFDSSDRLFVDCNGQVRMECAPAEGSIRIGISGSEPIDLVLATHPLLTLALMETCKRFGRFPLHAAGLSRDGRGVLIPGTSGAGKSTTTVSLVRYGFDFLSDDTVFLTSEPDGIWAAGFPDEIDVTAGTVAMFDELSALADQPMSPGRDKHGFRVEEVFGISPLDRCRPVALVFPRIGDGAGPDLEPLRPAEALLELTPNLFLTDPVSTQAHLDLLGDLVRCVPSYVFRPGADPDAAAACIAELVAP